MSEVHVFNGGIKCLHFLIWAYTLTSYYMGVYTDLVLKYTVSHTLSIKMVHSFFKAPILTSLSTWPSVLIIYFLFLMYILKKTWRLSRPIIKCFSVYIHRSLHRLQHKREFDKAEPADKLQSIWIETLSIVLLFNRSLQM